MVTTNIIKRNRYRLLTIAMLMMISLIGCNNQSQDSGKNQIILKHSDDFMIDYNMKATKYEDVLDIKNEFNMKSQLDNSELWSVLTVNDLGIAYGKTSKSKKGKINLISYDLNNKKYSIIDSNKDELVPLFIKENENYLVWIETKFSYDKCISNIKLYDKSSKKVKIISKNEMYYRANDSIALGEDYILWYEVENKNGQNIPNIKRYDIKTEETSIFKENAKSPVIGDNFIAYLAPDNGNKVAMYIDDGNDQSVVVQGVGISEIAANKNSILISYIENDIYKLAVWENGKLSPSIIENSMYPFEFLEFNDSFIYWASITQTMIYDRKSNKTLLIDGDEESAKAYCSNKYIINCKTIDFSKNTDMNMTEIYVKELN